MKSPANQNADLLFEVVRLDLSEHILSVRWSFDGRFLSAAPAEGLIGVYDLITAADCRLVAHGTGNSAIAWHPTRHLLATCGEDGQIRIYGGDFPFSDPMRQVSVGKGWIGNLAWNRDGSLLAISIDRSLLVYNPFDGSLVQRWDEHKSTVCDLTWNPLRDDELVTVCDGGFRFWKLGRSTPFDQFNWGGASLRVAWSPDGRWVATGDQTASVHIYDVSAGIPLHIQGFPTRVRALAWEHSGKQLATTGGDSIEVWPCTGRKGPDGASPIQLYGHRAVVGTLDFAPGQTVLVSGAKDGLLLLWLPLKHESPALLAQENEEITDVRFSPKTNHLAYGTAEGVVSILNLALAPR